MLGRWILVWYASWSLAVGAGSIEMNQYVTLGFGAAQGLARWGVNATHLEIQLTYPTTGWMAFGLSPDGRMGDSDVLFGYVDDVNKEVVLQVRYTTK